MRIDKQDAIVLGIIGTFVIILLLLLNICWDKSPKDTLSFYDFEAQYYGVVWEVCNNKCHELSDLDIGNCWRKCREERQIKYGERNQEKNN